MTNRYRVAPALLLLGLAAAGCSSPNPYPAPEIVGIDQHAIEFQLSEFRGKVVMLDFWGNW